MQSRGVGSCLLSDAPCSSDELRHRFKARVAVGRVFFVAEQEGDECRLAVCCCECFSHLLSVYRVARAHIEEVAGGFVFEAACASSCVRLSAEVRGAQVSVELASTESEAVPCCYGAACDCRSALAILMLSLG